MARIRKLSIQNFRSIQQLDWAPGPGLNCLIGPGDSGKSTILDAIDFCLGARRNLSFNDTDFYMLNVENPIVIEVTLGALPDALKSFDAYGDFLRGFDAVTGQIEDEPGINLETVITLTLSVSGNLEPHWFLYSERAEQQLLERSLIWADRVRLAPARIGAYTQTNLSWSRNSVLNRLTAEKTDLSAELAGAARTARTSFGTQASPQLQETLHKVNLTAVGLGVPIGPSQALLDANALSISDGAIALHNKDGIPLHALGTGSSRLLVAGLQRAAADSASIALVDEVEHGLEPHRLIRLLDSLGAKEEGNPPLQVFLTTHSPVALRELNGSQLVVVRPTGASHSVLKAGNEDDVQSTLRSDPEAFLAKYIIVCEGASEVGLIRGMDQYWSKPPEVPSVTALGGAFVNVNGGTPDKSLERGIALAKLGYRVVVISDADKAFTPEVLDRYQKTGNQLFTWRPGRALEDELFLGLSNEAIDKLLDIAKETTGADLMSDHIKSRSDGKHNLDTVESYRLVGEYPPDIRAILGLASRIRKKGWFKSVSAYQRVAVEALGPINIPTNTGLLELLQRLWAVTHVS